MDKHDLSGIFRTAKNNIQLVYAALVVFSHEDMADFFGEFSSRLDVAKPHNENYIVCLLKDEKASKIAFRELYDSTYRSALKELFEVTKAYCTETDQLSMLKAQPWYQFWRILRNCLSHDFLLRFHTYEKSLLPVCWRGITIDSSMDGQQLTHELLSRERIMEFIEEVHCFVDEHVA